MSVVLDGEAATKEIVDAVVDALPTIVRALNAGSNRLSPGLRLPQVRALVRVARHEGLTMGELARQLGSSQAAATQVVDQLVALGLVERARGDQDRRVVRLHLTARARPELAGALAWRARQVAEVCAQLAPEEARGFARGMQLLGVILTRDAAAGEQGGEERAV